MTDRPEYPAIDYPRATRPRHGHDRRPIQRSVWPWVFALGIVNVCAALAALVWWVM